jgi:hypothetical protein
MITLTPLRLLRSIDLKQVDPQIILRCKEAYHALQRGLKANDDPGQVQRALAQVRAAVQLAAANTPVDKRAITADQRRRSTIGAALLYQAYLQHLAGDGSAAILTAQTAQSWLRHDEYHLLLGQLLVARLAHDDDLPDLEQRAYQAALPLLDKMIERQHRKRNVQLKAEYVEVQQAVQRALSRLSLRNLSVPGTVAETPAAHWLDRLPLPAELIWPGSDLIGLQLTPTHSADQHTAILSHQANPAATLDYIETDTLSLEQHTYRLRSPVGDKFRLAAGQLYYVFQLMTNKPAAPDQPSHVLVRPRDRIPAPDAPLVLMTSVRRRAWLVESRPATPAATVIGERQWKIQDGAETLTYNESDIDIVGAVVALLIPFGS